jgi:hypothetical protein
MRRNIKLRITSTTLESKPKFVRAQNHQPKNQHQPQPINRKMPRTFRVAVLECDTPIEPVIEGRGRYGVIFRSLLTRGLESLGGHDDLQLEVSHWDVVGSQKYPSPGDFDGLLLSGSSMLF